jgi:xylulose-5-phosphate/fructose-6-phosphate phosphoketolase
MGRFSETQAISAYGLARSTVQGGPLDAAEPQLMQAYWDATQNPLLRQPPRSEHVKRRLLATGSPIPE